MVVLLFTMYVRVSECDWILMCVVCVPHASPRPNAPRATDSTRDAVRAETRARLASAIRPRDRAVSEERWVWRVRLCDMRLT